MPDLALRTCPLNWEQQGIKRCIGRQVGFLESLTLSSSGSKYQGLQRFPGKYDNAHLLLRREVWKELFMYGFEPIR